MRSNQPMSRGSLSMVLATAIVMIFAIAGTGTAFAACSDSFDCFAASDGNQISGPNGLTDWQDIAGDVATAADPAKGDDTQFSGGNKETEPGNWKFITGNNTPKTDVLEGWSHLANNVLEVSFVRVKQSGNTFLSFELNQKAAIQKADGSYYPQRSTGDILFTYDIDTTNRLSFGMCTWDGDSSSGVWRRLDGTAVANAINTCTRLPDSGPPPIATGSVNWNRQIAGFLGRFDPIPAGRFGEAAVDFGSNDPVLVKFLQGAIKDPCGPNGWFWMHSRAAESVTSQPKDVLTGGPLTNPTCDFTLDKKVSLSGAPGTFVDSDAQNPLAATVGAPVTYSVTVANTGDSAMTFDVTDNSALCDAGSPLAGPNGEDGVDDVIAAGTSLTYTCQHTVTGNEGGNPFQNVACANAAEMHAGNTKCDEAWVKAFQPGELGGATGTKFLDEDSSGTRNGSEAGVSGFVFYVDYNDSGAFDAGEPAAASASDGTWTISGVVPGTYNVREVADPNFKCTTPSPCLFNVAVAGGATATAGEFGNAPVPKPQPPEGQQVSPDGVQGGSTPDGQIVLGERVAPGSARLLGPTGCQARAFHARIRGKKVARVVFTLDGHRIKTLSRKNFRGTYAVRIDPRRLAMGVHRLVVKVTFQRGSGTKAKTFRLAFQRCPRALRAPRFTG